MILIGSMEWASTVARGEFYCPNCQAAKSFQRKIVRPFLTLYFIPVVPIGGLREFVLCRGCRERFDPSILLADNPEMLRNANANSAVPTFEVELLRIIALTIMDDSHVSETEVQMAMRIYHRMAGRELSRIELQQACRESTTIRVSPSTYVGVAGQHLTYDQKLMMVQAMFAVAGADGSISPSRLKSLMEAQHQLELNDIAFQTAIKDAEQWIS